jgi:HrpA-like RNA helicase
MAQYIPPNDTPRRVYEGGTSIPQPKQIDSKQRELYDKFWHKFSPNAARETRSVPERFTDFDLGHIPQDDEQELPVASFRNDILKSVAENQITIITAETGAGKSTQIPQYLLESGYIVNMTQPRRLSAVFVAEEIERQVEGVLGANARDLVGYHTAENNTTTDNTRITVLTDGLRLVQEFGEREELEHEVLVIDEVHEWNSNIEMLIAQTKRLMKDRPELRVVITSATMEADKLAKYFADGDRRNFPPVIDIPGRNHEVTRIDEPESTVVDQAVLYAKMGENILIFLPGVREIEDTISAIKKKLEQHGVRDAALLKLHSKMSQRDQDAVKSSYPGPKIICATNIAQTSITIPDVTVVIDSGLERRTEIDEESVQSLNLRVVSRADMNQRAGRTGRVAPGVYVNTRLNEREDYVEYDSHLRSDYPVPEILRTDVDRNTLLAASTGLDFAELDLFHPVDQDVIERSKRSLKMLEAMDDDGLITAKGMRMVRLPMRPIYARMIIEAEDLGYSMNVRANVAAMTAALEVGGLPSWLRDSSKDWRNYSEESSSDVITQADLLIESRNLSRFERERDGFDVRNIERAEELYLKICKRTNIPYSHELLTANAEEREQLRRVIASGMIDSVYQKVGISEYRRMLGRTGVLRSLSDRTTVTGRPSYVVGTQYRIERYKSGTKHDEHILQDVTSIPRSLLAEIGSSVLRSWSDIGLQWRDGRLMRVQEQLFRGVVSTGILREEDALPNRESINEVRQYVMKNSGSALRELKSTKKMLEELKHLTDKSLPTITQDDLYDLIDEAIDGQHLNPGYVDRLLYGIMTERRLQLDDLISPEDRREILENSPAKVEYNGVFMDLKYRNGKVFFDVKNLEDVQHIHDDIYLKDGRQILIRYNKREFSIHDFRDYVKDRV